LFFFLIRRGYFVPDARLASALPRIGMSAAALAVAIWFALALLEAPLNGTTPERVGALALLVVGGIVFYAAIAHVTDAARLGALRELLRGRDAG
jgi:putative peptidoglycan lipid II flippase